MSADERPPPPLRSVRRGPLAQQTPQRSLKARALQWLAQREHSRAELRRKLLPHARALAALGEDVEAAAAMDAAAQVDALLDWLEAHRHLSDQRFVESRVHARAARFGTRRIEQELAQHGVALDAAAAEQLRTTEHERARDVWARKFGRPAVDAAERARQARFLTARGFGSEAVRRVLRAASETASGVDASSPGEDD